MREEEDARISVLQRSSLSPVYTPEVGGSAWSEVTVMTRDQQDNFISENNIAFKAT